MADREIRTEAGLIYRVEKTEKKSDLFDEPGDDIELQRLKRVFGAEEKLVYGSMDVWREDIRDSSYLHGIEQAMKRWKETNAYEKYKFLRPREYWFEFRVELGDLGRRALIDSLLDGFSWEEDEGEFSMVFYSLPPSYPIDFVLVGDHHARCGGGKESASSLGMVVANKLHEQGKFIENTHLVVVEALARYQIFATQLHPQKKEIGIISMKEDFPDKEDEEDLWIGWINFAPFWMIPEEYMEIKKLE